MTTIKLEAAPAWIDRLKVNTHKAGMQAAMDAARKGWRDIVAVILPSFGTQQPVGRGTYKAGWRAEATPRGARVYNRTYPQAPLIEYGVPASNVKPGRAMREALEEWIHVKGLSPRDPKMSILSFAWAIAMSLKKHGIFNGGRGLHIIDKAVPIMVKEFGEAFKRRVDRLAGR